MMGLEQLTQAEIGYIAGLVDADGTITYAAKDRRNETDVVRMPLPMVLVVNSNFEVIEYLKEKIGSGCAYLTKSKPTRPDQDSENWRPVHRFQITGKHAVDLCAAIHPLLIVKRRQAEILMAHPLKGRSYTRYASDEQRADALNRLSKIRDMNRRGIAA